MDFQSIIEGVRSNGEILMVGLVNKTMSNPRFTTSIVKAMEASISFKAAVDKNLHFAYKSMNITSRADFDNLTRNVSELLTKQGGLDSEIEKLSKRIDKISKQAEKDKT